MSKEGVTTRPRGRSSKRSEVQRTREGGEIVSSADESGSRASGRHVWRRAGKIKDLWINNVDYASNVESLGLDYGAEMLDETAMGDDTRINKGGLKTWSVSVNAHQDFAAAQVGANLFALVGTTVCFEIRPENSCSTAINPSYYAIGILENAPPVGGGVGSLLDTAFAIQSAGTLSRASSS